MKVVLLGPPGSGTGTQAARLSARLGITRLSAGDLLREAVTGPTSFGRRIADVVARGELVQDDLMVELMQPEIVAAARGAGYVLEGYPRTEQQAAMLLGGDARPDLVVALDVPESFLIDRILTRARAEDRPHETPSVIGNRLAAYRRTMRPLFTLFDQHGLLRIIDANVSRDNVTEAVLEQLVSAGITA